MKPALRALALAALLLAPLLPTASAGVPEPRGWAPYDAISDINTLAMASEGTTIAVALKQAVTAPNTGAPSIPGTGSTRVAQSDLAILSSESGFARNGTSTSTTPLGRTHAAVSRLGDVVASLGNESGVGTPAAGVLTLYYARVPAGADWTTTPTTDIALRLDGAPSRAVGLALSDDGNRVAVLLQQDAGNYSLRGFTFSGGALNTVFDHRAPGVAHGLGASRDLSRIAVAGQFSEGNATFGGLLRFPFAQASPEHTYLERAANGTSMRSAAVSADGSRIAAGTSDGRVLLFQGNAAEPTVATLGVDNVTALAVSADGSRVSAAAGTMLGHFDAASGLRLLWNTTISGIPANLALNRTGGILVVAIPGSGGGAFAYGDKDGQPIWRFQGDTRGAAVNANGTELAYAQRSFVTAARIPRDFVFEFPGGAKTSPSQVVPANGTTRFELTVRNPGAAPERIVFEGPADAGLTVTANPPVVLVNPGAVERVSLDVAVGPGFTGSRVFNVTARALGTDLVDSATLSVAVESRAELSLFLNESEVVAEANVTTTLLVAIINNGTRDAAVGLRATQAPTQGPEWNLTVEQTSFNVLPRTTQTVRVFMTPPADVANGTSNRVTFALEGPNVSEVRHVTYRVNPTLSVEVNATGLVKFVEPGRTAFYNITVANTGSLARQFEAYYEVTSTGGKDWPIEMSTQPFRIEAGQRATVPVRIVAPLDITPEDRTSVRVFVRSIPEQVNETVVGGNVTLFANYQAPRPTTTTPTGNAIPFPTPLLAMAIAAAVAASLCPRRRRP